MQQYYQNQQRDTMITENLHLVKFHAIRLRSRLPAHVEIDDLINYGVIGLMDAVDKFDVTRGVKFKTYAELRIRGAMIDGLRDQDWVPRSFRRRQREVETALRKLEVELGRAATDEEVAAELGIDLEQYYSLLDNLQGVSLGAFEPIEQGSEDCPVRYLPDREENSPTFVVEKKQIRDILAKGIDKLPEKERLVLSLYYFENLTMKEVGKVLDITESRVSQLHSKAVLRLRVRMKHLLGKE